MRYDKLCEMNIEGLMNALMGSKNVNGGCKLDNPIQPTDNVGEFGNAETIHINETEDGGLEIDSKELAIKLSSSVYAAIKSYLNKGD